MEKNDGSLYNIMHGVPGNSYGYFRFTKCFVWGKYYKHFYIKHKAEPNQFIVSGSIFHHAILNQKNIPAKSPDIDILYAMDGDVTGYKEVFSVLEKLSQQYRIRIKQHPRYKTVVPNTLKETDADIITAIRMSRLVIGHFTTALLDASVLKINVLSYLGGMPEKRKYVNYLTNDQIAFSPPELEKRIFETMNKNDQTAPGNIYCDFIDMKKIPLEVIANEIS